MISDPRPEPWPGGRAESGGPDVPVMTARCYHGSAAENSKGARHHQEFTQELPSKLLPTRAKEIQTRRRKQR
jgi:hypothetical protein